MSNQYEKPDIFYPSGSQRPSNQSFVWVIPLIISLFFIGRAIFGAILSRNQSVKAEPAGYTFFSMGNHFYELGDYAKAIEQFNIAINLSPEFGEAYNNRGLVYFDQGEYDKAWVDFDKAVQLTPLSATPHNNRGAAYLAKGNTDAGLSDLNKAIEMEEKFAKAYYNRGLAYLDLNNPDQAIADFTKAIEYTPEWVTKMWNRIPTSVATGEAPRLADLTSFINFMQSYAEPPLVYMQRAYAYLIKGEFDLAIADLNKALELGPDPETKERVETLLSLALLPQDSAWSTETASGNENLIPTETTEWNQIQGTIVPTPPLTTDTPIPTATHRPTVTLEPTLTPLPQAEVQGNSASLSMLIPRNLHTATLLSDGTVLLIGGNTAPGIDTNTTEIFDPISNTFTFSLPLNTPLHEHTSTLLQDERLLVIGGYGAGSWLNDAKIFDPTNGLWLYSQPLYPHGVVHTATLLPDGRVFVMGGAFRSGTSGLDDRAEVFDPLTNGWYTAAYHERTEANHTATLLMDDRILISGGLAEPAIYNPVTNEWSPAGSLIIPRAGAKAVLLKDGRVLLIGGFSPPSTGDFVTPSAEIYDPSSNSWRLTASMNQARYFHTATLLPDGRVVVIGGWNMVSGYENALSGLVEIFDPSNETWTVLSTLQIGRVTHTATLLNDGRILVTGGEVRYQEYLNSAILFTP